jgi:hypothetical protein
MKTRRNEQCPCGSGRKYKRCHGAVSSLNANTLMTSHPPQFSFGIVRQDDPCQCGNGKKFRDCEHGYMDGDPPDTPPPADFVQALTYTEGTTPRWLKKLIEAALKHVFKPENGVIQPRGESCATVSMTVVWLLKRYGIASRFIVGAAGWHSFPLFYRWGGSKEYHAWVETEHHEIVDLACDDLNNRTDFNFRIPAPKNCWDVASLLRDRGYVEIEYGHSVLDVDVPGKEAFDRIVVLAEAYCHANENAFKSRFT